ncbi:hypothetical protein GGR52DRAFT_379864 [Hypoxylon sp. FL1284]|nr:hypothetical protein GGR52DRAFT_379864 [Hypoxylon sp. FL1284]
MSIIPLIVGGHELEEVSSVFASAVEPDFEVVYSSTSPEAALPCMVGVLNGETPPGPPGLGRHGKLRSAGAARAIVLTAGYDDAFVAALRKQLGGKPVPILKIDAAASAPGPDATPTPEETRALADRALKVLKKLEAEGKLDGADDGLYAY